MKPKALTPKQAAFVREYLIDLNATQAAIRAGYSPKTSEEQGYQLLRKTSVKAEIQAAMDKRAAKTEVNSDRVLNEITKLAFADIRKVFDESGNLLPVHMLPDEIAASISSIEVVTSKIPGSDPVEVEHTAKIKFWDKRGSLEMLGRHLKLFTDKIEVDVTASLADRIKEARERTKQG
jgi:phage terminase small subunit